MHLAAAMLSGNRRARRSSMARCTVAKVMGPGFGHHLVQISIGSGLTSAPLSGLLKVAARYADTSFSEDP